MQVILLLVILIVGFKMCSPEGVSVNINGEKKSLNIQDGAMNIKTGKDESKSN